MSLENVKVIKGMSLISCDRSKFASPLSTCTGGRRSKEIEVGTQTGGLEWGYEFKVGERYLVYAQQAGDSKRGLVVKDAVARDLLTRPQKT